MRFVTDIPQPTYVDTPERVERAVRHCMAASMLGTDTETLGKWKNEDTKKAHHNMNDQVVVMGLSPDEETRYLVPRVWLNAFRPVLECEKVPKALHNAKFDMHRFANAGIALRGPIADGLVMDWLLDEDTRENRHGLKECGRDFFHIPMREYNDLFGKEDPNKISRPDHPLFEKYLDYSSLDPWVSRRLVLHHAEKLSQVQVWEGQAWSLKDHYWDIEEPQINCLWEMERSGVTIDTGHLDGVSRALADEMGQIAYELNRIVGEPINPNSVPQVQALFFEKMGLPVRKKTDSGAPAADEEVLSYFANQMQVKEAQLILDYRGASKMKGTYADGLAKRVWRDGRVHTTYNPTKVTGRLSSSDPNLQNLPHPDWDTHCIRAAFVPDGSGQSLICVDYSQLEMRVLACASGDPKMADAIRSGLDMHTFAASQALGITYTEAEARKKAKDKDFSAMRTGMKRVGFGIVFGAQAPTISNQLSGELKRPVSREEAQEYIDRYLGIFPGIRQYMDTYIATAKVKGYVQTVGGRFRRLSRIRSHRFRERSEAERQAINAPIQGSAADIVKKAMVACWMDDYLRSLGWTLRMQIHDELVFNGPDETAVEASQVIQAYMEHPFTEDLVVPLTATPLIVKTWFDAK
mgnify:CR=1 FL=1